MVNILFDCPNTEDFYEGLKQYFDLSTRVTVVALSFRDDYVNSPERPGSVYGNCGHTQNLEVIRL